MKQIKYDANTQRNTIAQRRGKKDLLQVKYENKYQKSNKQINLVATNPISLMSPNAINFSEETFHFFKHSVGAINEIQSYISALYSLLLGTVIKTKPRKLCHMLSVLVKLNLLLMMRIFVLELFHQQLEGFKSLNDYLKNADTIDWDAFTELLITKGYGKFAAADILYQDPDAHWSDMGFNILGLLIKIDLDRALWPITCIFQGAHPAEEYFHDNVIPEESFPFNTLDFVTLPILQISKPYNGLAI